MEKTIERLRALIEGWDVAETLPDDAADLKQSMLIQITLLQAQLDQLN